MTTVIDSVPVRTPSATRRIERFDTIVVGGGQAGLAAGQQLAERDADFVIVDAEARVGDAWRKRWDSLRLFTPAAYSGLPGMPFPAPPAHLPDKDETADYLERYAEKFDLPIRSGVRVESMSWNGEHFVVRAGDAVFESSNVIVATGPLRTPRIPSFAARLAPSIHQLHSSSYRNPFDLPDGPVLVVGAAPSGAQIAAELVRFRPVWLAGRRTGYLPRRILGRDLFDWLWPVLTRATTDTFLGRRLRELVTDRGDALIGVTERSLARAGITRVGRVTGERGGLPVCDDRVVDPRVIVWSTGFTPDYAWIGLPVLDGRGRPRHRRGVSTDVDGLYFVGLPFQHRRSSSLLGGVGSDASFIAEQVIRRGERSPYVQ